MEREEVQLKTEILYKAFRKTYSESQELPWKEVQNLFHQVAIMFPTHDDYNFAIQYIDDLLKGEKKCELF